MSLNNKKYQKNSLTHFWRPLYQKRAILKKKETPLCTPVKASFTVEAAITVPVFVFLISEILFFFCILLMQIKIESALHYAARTVAAYACMEKEHGDSVNSATELGMAEILFQKQIKQQNVQTEYITGSALGISLLTSELSGEYVSLQAVYQIKFPVSLIGERGILMHQTVKARKWTGAIGADVGEEWVYITPTGTVYHRTKSCSYLDLSIHLVALSEIDSLRNKAGSRYQQCARCKNNSSGLVYITDYGTVYHGEAGCSGLKRTVYKVKLKDTGERGACIKCGGEK